MFTEQDIEQIGAHGLCVADAERQMLRFREGFPYLDICRAAVAGDRILQADRAAAGVTARFTGNSVRSARS